MNRPILMMAWEVRAILDGNKDEMCRLVVPARGRQSEWLTVEKLLQAPRARMGRTHDGVLGAAFAHPMAGQRIQSRPGEYIDVGEWSPYAWVKCPYGEPGDRLWVRETWATPGNFNHIKPSQLGSSHFYSSGLAYRATEPHGDVYYKWRPSIHMPRWASRITLEVTDVRVERVQDITPSDCETEGITGVTKATPARGQPHEEYRNGDGLVYSTPRDAFRELWNEINEKRGYGWEANPWVWFVKFRRVEGIV